MLRRTSRPGRPEHGLGLPTEKQDWRAIAAPSKPLPPFGKRLEQAGAEGRFIREVSIYIGHGAWGDPYKLVAHMGDTESRFGLTIPPGSDLKRFRWPIWGIPVGVWATSVDRGQAEGWCNYLMNQGALACWLVLEDSNRLHRMEATFKRQVGQ